MKIIPTPEEFKTCPAVFAVKDYYQIMVPVKSDLLFWVTIDGEEYYDHSNGIIRSSTRMHRVNVPAQKLDEAGEYTVTYRKIINRKPYFPETEDEVSITYPFKPVPNEGKINIYHLSDTHGKFDMPSKASEFFGDELDLFVLNGDIPDHSGAIENFDLIYKLCEHATQGQRPCIFSRGNHDTRGFFAENIAEYTPTEDGHSYFSFRLGRVWGIVMDCGEDKVDSHEEYGHTVSCSQFRREETRYLENVIKNSDSEYNADGIDYRLVIVHNPFTYTINPPFDIEQELFGYWNKLLGENVQPDAFISGHLHTLCVSPIGGELDSKGQYCPVIVGSNEAENAQKQRVFVGCAITLDNDKMVVKFTTSDLAVISEETLDLTR